MNWLKKFFALPDLGRWHRRILNNEALLEQQRKEAPPSPYESDRWKQARADLDARGAEVVALRKVNDE